MTKVALKSTEEVNLLAYQPLMTYATSIGLDAKMKKKKQLREEVLAKHEELAAAGAEAKPKSKPRPVKGKVKTEAPKEEAAAEEAAKADIEAEAKEEAVPRKIITALAKEIKKHTAFPLKEKKAKEKLSGDVTILIEAVEAEEVGAVTIVELTKLIKAGKGRLVVAGVQKDYVEVKVADKDDVVTLPIGCVHMVNVPQERAEGDGETGVEGVKKGHDPKDAIKQYNALNDTEVVVVSVEKKKQGKSKVYTVVTLSNNGVECQMSASRVVAAVSAGNMIEAIETEIAKPKATNKKSVVADPELDEEQKAIIADTTTTKSDKVRALYKRGLTVAHIHRVIGIHYSFAYCVVSNYRALLAKKDPEVTEETGTKKD